MRSYIRHPADIPIQIDSQQAANDVAFKQLSNVSHGGLAFESPEKMTRGSVIKLRITLVEPEFEAEGIVTHCSHEQDHYVIGVEFIHRDDLYVARMVEQICHIEHYRKEIAEREGRHLTGQEAAREWIDKYAASFPQWTNR